MWQAGFHVDRAGELIASPTDIPERDILLLVTLVARAIAWPEDFKDPDI